jgi:hypothetical protein
MPTSRGQAAMPVPQQGRGDDAGPEAEVGAGLHDVLGLDGADERVPAVPARPVRLGGADPVERIARHPPGHLGAQVLVLVEFLGPRPDLADIGSGDGRYEPAQLIAVELVEVVREVMGLAVAYQPAERPPDQTGVVAHHIASPQR